MYLAIFIIKQMLFIINIVLTYVMFGRNSELYVHSTRILSPYKHKLFLGWEWCILASMIYFDSDMSKSTNTVVYFDWKTVIYIYVCGKCRTQSMLQMENSVTFTGAYAKEIIPSINRSFVY